MFIYLCLLLLLYGGWQFLEGVILLCVGVLGLIQAGFESHGVVPRLGALVLVLAIAGSIVWYTRELKAGTTQTERALAISDERPRSPTQISDAQPHSTGSLCGRGNAPRPVGASAWLTYRCASETEAGPRWAVCLPRSAYTRSVGRGCPGEELCCPHESDRSEDEQ